MPVLVLVAAAPQLVYSAEQELALGELALVLVQGSAALAARAAAQGMPGLVLAEQQAAPVQQG